MVLDKNINNMKKFNKEWFLNNGSNILLIGLFIGLIIGQIFNNVYIAYTAIISIVIFTIIRLLIIYKKK